MKIWLTNVPFFGTRLTLCRTVDNETVKECKDYLNQMKKGEGILLKLLKGQKLLPHILFLKGDVVVLDTKDGIPVHITIRVRQEPRSMIVDCHGGTGDIVEGDNTTLMCHFLLEGSWSSMFSP